MSPRATHQFRPILTVILFIRRGHIPQTDRRTRFRLVKWAQECHRSYLYSGFQVYFGCSIDRTELSAAEKAVFDSPKKLGWSSDFLSSKLSPKFQVISVQPSMRSSHREIFDDEAVKV